MRLLHTSDYRFKEFIGSNIPEYAIISHRWSDEEVSHQDFLETRARFLEGQCQGYGWEKISKACHLARSDDVEWVWIDTCCIDKKSSAELTEAINSMFAWYRESRICYAFLPDVQEVGDSLGYHAKSIEELPDLGLGVSTTDGILFWHGEFVSSEWFTRAWTLQELIAPRNLVFFNSNFRPIGTRRELAELANDATDIPLVYLWGTSDRFPCVGARMKWASKRKATRVEDLAYSLLGLFDVNIPLLYGEGAKAFQRLQLEIFRQSDDESIFVWHSDVRPHFEIGNLFSPTLEYFSKTTSYAPHPIFPRQHFEVTNKGIRMVIHLSTERLRETRKTSEFNILIPLNLFTLLESADSAEPKLVYEVPCLRVLLETPRTEVPFRSSSTSKYFEGYSSGISVLQVADHWEMWELQVRELKDAGGRKWDAIAGDDTPGMEAFPVYFPHTR